MPHGRRVTLPPRGASAVAWPMCTTLPANTYRLRANSIPPGWRTGGRRKRPARKRRNQPLSVTTSSPPCWNTARPGTTSIIWSRPRKFIRPPSPRRMPPEIRWSRPGRCAAMPRSHSRKIRLTRLRRWRCFHAWLTTCIIRCRVRIKGCWRVRIPCWGSLPRPGTACAGLSPRRSPAPNAVRRGSAPIRWHLRRARALMR